MRRYGPVFGAGLLPPKTVVTEPPRNARPIPVKSEPARASSTAPRRIWLATVLVLVVLGGWMSRFGPEPTADDYGQYLMHAQALVEGRSYTDIDYVFSHYAWGTGPPIAAPGFSLTLAPVLATVGYGDWLHTGLMLAAVLALAVLAARYFGRWNAVHGAAVAFLLVVALLLARAGTTLYPDVPFAVCCWLVILLADGEERWSWWRVGAIAFFGVWALLYRTAGIPLIPAMALFGVLSWRTLGLKPFVHVVVWSLTFWLLYEIAGAGRFPATPPDFVESGIEPTTTLLGRIVRNAALYRWPLFELQLYPFSTRIPNAAYHVVATGIMLWALLRWVLSSWYRFAVVFMCGYVAMLLLAPVQTDRYLWPLFPIAAYGLVRGLDTALKVGALARLSSAVRIMVPLAVLSALAVGSTVANPPRPTVLQDENLRALFQHVRGVEAVRPDVRVLFLKPRTLAWHAGVPAMMQFPPPHRDVALSELRTHGITHVVLGTLGLEDQGANAAWRELVTTEPERFRLEYSNEAFEVYAFVGD